MSVSNPLAWGRKELWIRPEKECFHKLGGSVSERLCGGSSLRSSRSPKSFPSMGRRLADLIQIWRLLQSQLSLIFCSSYPVYLSRSFLEWRTAKIWLLRLARSSGSSGNCAPPWLTSGVVSSDWVGGIRTPGNVFLEPLKFGTWVLSIEYLGVCCVQLKVERYIVASCDYEIHGWTGELVRFISSVFQYQRESLAVGLMSTGWYLFVLSRHAIHLSCHHVGTQIQRGSCHCVKSSSMGPPGTLDSAGGFINTIRRGLSKLFHRRAVLTVLLKNQ